MWMYVLPMKKMRQMFLAFMQRDTDVITGAVNREGYKEVASQLARQFGFEKVAITLRESISANDNNWSAMLFDGTDYYFSRKYAMHIVDRVGGGGQLWRSDRKIVRGLRL